MYHNNHRTPCAGLRMIFRLLLLLLLILTARTLRADNEPSWPPKTFPIACWCSPPEPYINHAQYRRIANAGFTVLLPPAEGKMTPALNHKILETARYAGLKAIIADERMPHAIGGNREALNAIKSIVNDYHRDSALMGYFLTDEPGADQFAGLAEVVAEFHRLDPEHIVYINLFPSYATTNLEANPSQLKANSYDAYLDAYMQAVKPQLLSWDYYPFLKDSDRPGFFGNLTSVQRVTLSPQYQLPFWQVVLSVQHGGYRMLTENEIRFEAMQSLVYGATGLAYFTYWLPSDPTFTWSNGISNRDGTDGPLYTAVRQVNREVSTLEKYLYGTLPVETFLTGEVPSDAHGAASDDTIRVTGPGNLSVGVFRGAQGYLYVLVTNRDYKAGIKTKMSISLGKREVEILEMGSNRWSVVSSKHDADEHTLFDLDLKPAGVALLRWQ